MIKYSQIRPFGLILLAIVVIPLPTLGFELPKFVVLSTLSTLAALHLLLSKEPIIRLFLRTISGKLYLAFGLAVLLSIAISVAPIASIVGVAPRFQGVLTYCCAMILGIDAAHMVQSKRGRATLLYAIISTNMLVVLYGTMQMLKLDPFKQWWLDEAFLGRVFSTIGHPNMLGQFIVLTLPFVGIVLQRAQQRVVRLWWFACITLNMVVLFGTVSRSAMLGAGVLVLLSAPVIKQWVKEQRTTIKAGHAFVLSFFVVIVASIGFLFFAQRFSQSFELGRSSSAREVIWSVAATMIAHRPQGWGLDTMAFTSPGYIGKEIYAYESLTTVVDRAHNELLQMLLSVGFVGCALWLVLVASVLYGSWQHGQQDRSGMLKAAGRGIAAYAVTLLFGFPSLVTLVFFWVLIGICIGRLEGKDVSTPQWVERSVQCVFTAIAVIALVVSVQWMHARWLYAQARVTEGLRTFQYDRQNLIDAAQVHLFALEQNPGDASIAESTEAIIEILNHLTAGQDGMVHILRAWLAATQGDSERTYASLNAAHTFYYQSIMEHRAALHILSLIGDTVGAYEHESAIRSFLPNAFFDESSQLHRILLKQHPWLEHITDAPPRGE